MRDEKDEIQLAPSSIPARVGVVQPLAFVDVLKPRAPTERPGVSIRGGKI